MSMMNQARVTLYVWLPGEFSPKAIDLNISHQMSECMSPLPRDRELHWAGHSQKKATEMILARQDAAKHIAGHITEALLKMFKSKDTINGYSPKEWADMHKT